MNPTIGVMFSRVSPVQPIPALPHAEALGACVISQSHEMDVKGRKVKLDIWVRTSGL